MLGTGVKAIQQGSGTESVGASTVEAKTIVIEAVVLAKAAVQAWICGPKSIYGETPTIAPVLTGTTELTLHLSNPDNAAQTLTYTWQVIEYY